MILQAIKNRKSIRSYKPDGIVTDEQIHELLEAGMLAPSACGMRPWEFIVVKNRDMLNKFMEIHPYTSMLKTASLAIIVCLNESLVNDISVPFLPQDGGATTENIMLQAAELGLGTCWCGIYPKRSANFQEILELPDDVKAFSLIAVGVPNEEFGSRGFYEEGKVRYIN